MTISLQAPKNRFHDDLTAILPRLRRHGLALTRDRHAMEDLVQNTVMRALAAQHSFQPGTNFSAWINVILRNEFISGIRRARPTVPFDEDTGESIAVAPAHDDRLMVRELTDAMGRLPRGQRDVMLLSTLSGLNYAQIADVVGCRPGTVKSRIWRARWQLHGDLMGVAAGDANVAPQNGKRSFQRKPAAEHPITGHRPPPPRVLPAMQMAIAR